MITILIINSLVNTEAYGKFSNIGTDQEIRITPKIKLSLRRKVTIRSREDMQDKYVTE